jgi:putative FmdB family regulatory protein
MPIYAYKCASCGHADDVMRKISDAPLTTCTACGKDTFEKQLTAPGFQLKGSGWYATEFKGGNKPAEKTADKAADKTDSTSDTKTESKPAESAASAAPAAASGAGTGVGNCAACTD